MRKALRQDPTPERDKREAISLPTILSGPTVKGTPQWTTGGQQNRDPF